MEPVTVGAVATTIVGAAGTAMGAWVRGRVHRQRAREDARRDHLRHLPPGSRLIDLGEHGLVIEVGSGAGREPSPGAEG